MRWRGVCALLILGTVLSGCVSGQDEAPPSEPAPPAYATSLEAEHSAELFANAAAADAERWFLLSTNTTPEGAVAGFRWAVPEEVRQSSGAGWVQVILEVAPIVSDRGMAADQDWALFAFTDDKQLGGLALAGAILEPTTTYRSFLPVLGADGTFPPTSFPRYLSLFVETTETIYFALAAKGPSNGSFGLGIRALTDSPFSGGEYNVPADSFDTFLREQAVMRPYVPARAGTGTGLLLDTYASLILLFALGAEQGSGNIEVEDRLPADARPVVTARDVTIRSTGPQQGWGLAQGLYLGYAGAGTWAADVDVYGGHAAGHSLVANAPYATLALWILFGIPIFSAYGEGDEGSTVTFDLDLVNLNYLDLLTVVNVGIGTTLTDLFGKPATEFGGTFTGLLGDVPPSEVRWQDDTLTIVDGQRRHTLVMPLYGSDAARQACREAPTPCVPAA